MYRHPSTAVPAVPLPIGFAMGRITAALLALTVVVLALPALAAAPTFPKLSGRVVDEADILSPATEQALTQKLQALETSTGRQLVVATVPSLQGQEIEDYGYQLGRAWGIGSEKTDDGAILLVAPAERKVRIEVGYGLEPVLTDALSSVIIQSVIIPKFKAGDMEGGIVAGADAVIQQLGLPDDQAKAVVAQAAEQPRRAAGPPKAFLAFLLFGFVGLLFNLLRAGRRRRGRGGRRGRDDDDDHLGPLIIGGILGNMLGGGGGGGGWSGGGGGFSGGGGSFGGGGASGGW